MRSLRYALLGLGTCLALLALLAFYRELQFVLRAKAASGIVVDQRVVTSEHYLPHPAAGYSAPDFSSSERASRATSEVAFRDASGRPFKFQTGSSLSLRPGDPVGVLYDPRDPGRAQLDGFSYAWGDSLTLMALAVGSLGFALAGRQPS